MPLRRLNRIEYEPTVCDLLRLTLDLRGFLPPDAATNGFDTNSGGQHVSSFLMERYLGAAEGALNAAISNSPKAPPAVSMRLSLKDERHVKVTTEKVFRHRDDGLVMFSSSPWQTIMLSQFYPPDRGTYRFRVSVTTVQSSGKSIPLRIDAGPMLTASKTHHVGYLDTTADKATTIEFTDHLGARSTIRIVPYGLTSAQAVHKIGADGWDGPGVLVHAVEVEGPLHDVWVDARPPQHVLNPADLVGKTRSLFDLIHLALQTDSTRLVTTMSLR